MTASALTPRALRGLTTALIAYGVVGLTAAVIGLVVLFWASGRVDSLATRLTVTVESVADTIEDAGVALDDAASTAVSVAVTLERTPPIVRQTATTLGNLEGNLVSVADQLGNISILGQRPLGGVAVLVDDMAQDLEGLDVRLESVADELDQNKAALLGNAESLRALGQRLTDLSEQLRSTFLVDTLDDVRVLVTVLTLLLVVWTAIPAAGALGAGLWLRRELERTSAVSP